MLSPILWTSIATGKHADQHGMLGFAEPDGTSGKIRPVANMRTDSMTTSKEEKARSPEPDRRWQRELNENLDLLELNLKQSPIGSRPRVFDLLMQLRHEINGAYAAPDSRDES